MAVSIADQFLTAVQESHDFIPIHVASLRVDSVTGFDLYLQVRPDEPVVLYAERNTPFTEASRRRLVDNRVEQLFISGEQQDEYRRYLETNLVDILQDSEVETESKCEILYASAHGLMRDVYADPSTGGGLLRSRDLAYCTIGLLHHQRPALRHLIETAAADYDLCSHAVNGFVLGIGLAMRAGLGSAKELGEFGTGALLRDVGMTQIPESVRDNPGKLTVSQFEQLKRHPEMGEQILRQLGGANNSLAANLVRHHHEKYDGTGYPDRLAGTAIHPLVRVLTIADVFDALTTNRAHKPAMTTFEALRLMRTQMRNEFDPDLLNIFIRMMGNPDG